MKLLVLQVKDNLILAIHRPQPNIKDKNRRKAGQGLFEVGEM